MVEKEIMAEHDSYHERITGEEAERRLRSRGRNGYLTRYSKEKKSYVLTVFKEQTPEDVVMHLKIIITDRGQHKIEGKDMSFANIKTLLEHYEQNRIDPALKTIGQRYTLEDFTQREREEKERREREQREREEREKREREEREERERREREEREKTEREERERKERELERKKREMERRERKEKERREREEREEKEKKEREEKEKEERERRGTKCMIL